MKQHGGARPGAGASVGNENKAIPPSERRVMQSFRLKPETIDMMRQYANEHSAEGKKMSLSEVIEASIKLICTK